MILVLERSAKEQNYWTTLTLKPYLQEVGGTTGGWGYFYAPLQIRYQRNFGVPVYGMTGRFVLSWADFGGLKQPMQLDVELASIVANATI